MARILLTEDQTDQRNLYHEVLSDAGYEVLDAWNGTEALELFQRNKPDVVVLDIQMPGVDGIEALGKILSKDRNVPVIFHSAYPSYKSNFLSLAADAFVVKSGEPAELLNTIRRVLLQRGIEASAPAAVTASQTNNKEQNAKEPGK